MSVDRPTFHESWSRVAGLTPRLRAAVRVRRQSYRGRIWHIAEDATGLQFFRLSEPAWRFVGLLDGRATVAEAWNAASEALGDEAPTQGEAIQLLGQLYSSNLLQADLPGDAETMFRRQQKRIGREVRGHLSSLLFLRVPLFDPDRFLSRWLPFVAWLFTPVGLVLWLAILAIGAWQLAGRGNALAAGAAGVLAPDNVILLYLTFAGIKTLHEMGHAFACKAFGRRVGGGEVHTIGLMFLVFMPIPYVDATSAWAFRSRLQRVIVGAAGMIVELAIAAGAAVVWAHSAEGSVTHALAYNAMFLASVSTLLFNGNPLMRYDGYYILADLLETPNLWQRSQEQLRWLVKRFAWGVRRLIEPAHTQGERWWFTVYGVASFLYRAVVYVGIMLFIAEQQFLLGMALIVFALVTWIAVPAVKFVHYLFVHHELDRTRRRAMLTTAGTLAALGLGLGVVPAPDHVRAAGVVAPARHAAVHAGTDGFVRRAAASGALVTPEGEPLVEAESVEWTSRRDSARAELSRLESARRVAMTEDVAQAQRLEQQIGALRDHLRWVEENIAALATRAPIEGVWVSPEAERLPGAYMTRGMRLGTVAQMDALVVRAVADQRSAGLLQDDLRDADATVEMRPRGRAGDLTSGRIRSILPAAQEQLPSASLGFAGGGEVATDPTDEAGGRTAEPVFEVRIDVAPGSDLLPGQRVIARFRLSDKPLLAQAWRAARQLVQQRLRI